MVEDTYCYQPESLRATRSSRPKSRSARAPPGRGHIDLEAVYIGECASMVFRGLTVGVADGVSGISLQVLYTHWIRKPTGALPM